MAGQRVDVDVLAHALDVTADELDAPLGELVSAGLLTATDATALVYRFEHSLVRETVEAAVAPRRPPACPPGDRRGAGGGARGRPPAGPRRAGPAPRRGGADRRRSTRPCTTPAGPRPRRPARRRTTRRPRTSSPRSASGRRRGARPGARRSRHGATCGMGLHPQSREHSREAFSLACRRRRTPTSRPRRRCCSSWGRTSPGSPAARPSSCCARRSISPATARRRCRCACRHRSGGPWRSRAATTRRTALIAVALERAREIGDGEALLVGLQAVRHLERRPGDDPRRGPRARGAGDGARGSVVHRVRQRPTSAAPRSPSATSTRPPRSLDRLRTATASGRFSMFELMAVHLDAILHHGRRRPQRGRGAGRAGVRPRRLRARASSAPASTACRCSPSAASRAAWPRSPRSCACSPRRRTRHRCGGPGSPRCTPSSGCSTRRPRCSPISPRPRSPTIPRDAMWPACLAFLAEACVALGDRDQAPVLMAELAPDERAQPDRGVHDVVRPGRPAARRPRRALPASPTSPTSTSMPPSRWPSAAARRCGPPRSSSTGPRVRAGRGEVERAADLERRGADAGGADRHGPAWRPGATAAPAPGPTRRPDGLSAARGSRCCGASPTGCRTGRSGGGSTSARTPSPTTCGRSCARPAAPTAPRRRPTPTAPASSRRADLDVGGRHGSCVTTYVPGDICGDTERSMAAPRRARAGGHRAATKRLVRAALRQTRRQDSRPPYRTRA